MNEPANFVDGSATVKNGSRYHNDFFRAAPTTASTIHLSSRTLLEALWQRKQYVWIANRLSNLSNIVDMEVCDMHSSQHWSSHYDLHSMFGWSETEPTLRGVQSSTGKRGLVLSRFNLSLPGFYSSAQVHFCRVGEMDRPLARRQLVSLGQHALLHHRCRQLGSRVQFVLKECYSSTSSGFPSSEPTSVASLRTRQKNSVPGLYR